MPTAEPATSLDRPLKIPSRAASKGPFNHGPSRRCAPSVPSPSFSLAQILKTPYPSPPSRSPSPMEVSIWCHQMSTLKMECRPDDQVTAHKPSRNPCAQIEPISPNERGFVLKSSQGRLRENPYNLWPIRSASDPPCLWRPAPGTMEKSASPDQRRSRRRWPREEHEPHQPKPHKCRHQNAAAGGQARRMNHLSLKTSAFFCTNANHPPSFQWATPQERKEGIL